MEENDGFTPETPRPEDLVPYLLNLGGFDEQHETWFELAEKFNISPDSDSRAKRAAAALARWRRFLGTDRGLEFKKMTFDKAGNVVSKTIGRAGGGPETPDLSTAKWYEHTSNATGDRGWTKYRNVQGYGLTDYQVGEFTEKLEGQKFSAPISNGSGIGIVDLSDLHTGAVLKYASETIKTLPFDIAILTDYLDEATAKVNAMRFKELYVFLPGDLIETFTAFNHKDTWKNVQSFQGGVTMVAYQTIKRLLSNLFNVKKVFMVEGNHDRLTMDKEGNSRKGIAEVMAFFLQENSGLNINYHPWMIRDEVDGVYHLCTHGDHKPFLKNDFWFRYGKPGIYNVMRTGHYHGFNILRQTLDNLHYQCPSVFTGNFFSESIGFDAVPAITITTHTDGIPSVQYVPLSGAIKNIKSKINLN